ncbi:MAG: 2-dehydropantoate 2-reductase [Reyranella sp.]|jgi:2-dehydropantoate 2-reductase|uniref:2-dehydropantoate 2-reductase n=1 Tax=Reyranella sp. TaxID=1929291 RepID=UPI0025F731F2|nr:2-dehydropantoate 2-reductase [Reyranella sp.]MBR2818166.1 2-dehydropantoate 2-reductase [Reyranella sp.]
MRLLVVGAGATGGYFGARLAQAGRDVTFLVRAGRAEQLRRSGLHIKSPHGDLVLEPKLATAGTLDRPFDAVILAVKAFALDAALADLAPAVGPQTMIVPFLNGMRHMETLIGRFGAPAVLGGVCIVATMLDREGRVVQLGEMQELAYGERNGTMSDRIGALDAQLQNAGFKAQASDTILLRMWEKWVLLATVGGVTCLMRGTVGEVEAAPGGAEFALAFLAECIAVATASGFAPREAFINAARGTITARGSGFASSMFRDMGAGAPLEADQIIGDLLERARRLGVATPLLAVANAHLGVYQNRVRREEPRAAAS